MKMTKAQPAVRVTKPPAPLKTMAMAMEEVREALERGDWIRVGRAGISAAHVYANLPATVQASYRQWDGDYPDAPNPLGEESGMAWVAYCVWWAMTSPGKRGRE